MIAEQSVSDFTKPTKATSGKWKLLRSLLLTANQLSRDGRSQGSAQNRLEKELEMW
jgi:hypothetical protein